MRASQQLRWAGLLLIALTLAGTYGYAALGNVSLIEGLYTTVFTLATVGYREPANAQDPRVQLFTVFIIVLGVVDFAWAVRSAAEIAVGDHVRRYLENRRLESRIGKLSGHAIICGFGRMGREIATQFTAAGKPFVVVDDNPEVHGALVDSGYPYIAGDARDEAVLREAGIDRASFLLSVASTDADNVFIVLTARSMNPNLFIVARSSREENERKLIRAGADRVVSPYVMGGRRIANAVLRPDVVEFVDELGRHDTDLEIGSIRVRPGDAWDGKSLAEMDLQDRFGVTVFAISRNGIYGPSPDPETRVRPGDSLMIIGPGRQVQAVRAE